MTVCVHEYARERYWREREKARTKQEIESVMWGGALAWYPAKMHLGDLYNEHAPRRAMVREDLYA